MGDIDVWHILVIIRVSLIMFRSTSPKIAGMPRPLH